MSFQLFVVIFLLGGWISARIMARPGLPSILGMVLFGIALGAFVPDSVPPLMWDLSPFLTSVALVVILLRAGLGIRRRTLARVGVPAGFLGFLPCLTEAAALTVAFTVILGLPPVVAALAATVIAAVSPAVVVPSMLDLKERGFGTRADVPTLVLAGASLDDVVAITLFTALLAPAAALRASSAAAGTESLMVQLSSLRGALARVPLSIVSGVLVGALIGFALVWFFSTYHHRIRATEKALVLLMLSLLTTWLGEELHFAALLAVMTVGFVLLERAEPVAHELAAKLGKVWVFAEIVLFVLIGMAVDIEVAVDAGWSGLAVITIGLVFRSLGVLLSLWLSRARLTAGERLFCVLSYLPKATVQAALGSVPLAAGVAGGEIILAVAVLSILVTAPLGLLSIRLLGPRLLDSPDGE